MNINLEHVKRDPLAPDPFICISVGTNYICLLKLVLIFLLLCGVMLTASEMRLHNIFPHGCAMTYQKKRNAYEMCFYYHYLVTCSMSCIDMMLYKFTIYNLF